MKNEILLEVKNLNVSFDGEKVIENLSFEVKEKEILTILGPNGSGKTTLLKALLGLIPFRGEIIWKKKVKISYLPERLSRREFSQIPLTVEEFFTFKKRKMNPKEILKAVGLEEKVLKKTPSLLSSGEFQRMLIAWSLIDLPDVLILDEPSSGIDIGGKETIYSLLYKFWKERELTLIFVTHDLNIVYGFSTNVLCLQKKKLCFGPPRAVLTPSLLQELYGGEIKFYRHNH